MEKTDGAHWEVSVRYCVLHVGNERSKDKRNRRPKLEQDGSCGTWGGAGRHECGNMMAGAYSFRNND